MGAQGGGGVVLSGQFRFGQGRVDLAVANVVHQDSRAALAALQFGDQVMQALRDIWWYFTATQGAYRVGHGLRP